LTLRTRLFALIILTVLPIIGVQIFDELDLRARRDEEGRDQALRLVRLVANEQSKVVAGARQLLTALGNIPLVRGLDAVSCNTFLTELARSYPQYLSIVSIDLAGHPVCATGPVEQTANLGDESFFKLAVATRAFTVGDYQVEDRSQRRVIYLAQPYFDSKGDIAGVVAAGLSLDWFNQEIARNPLPAKATVSVIDRQGTILARYPGREQFVGTQIPGQSHSNLLTGGEGVREAPGFDGIARIYSYAPLPDGVGGLTFSVGLNKGEFLKGANAENRRDAIVIGGSLLVTLLLAGIGARVFISRPVRALLDAAERLRQGNVDARVQSRKDRSEFGRLGMAFNAMAAAIENREQDLERRVRERTAALNQAMQAQQVAEAALHESRKMETIGRLTGGVAHDFNNLLAAIVGNIELARARLSSGHPGVSRLDAAMRSAKRGAGLVQQLLAFARRQTLRPATVDLNRHIRGSEDMLQRLLRSDLTVETRLSPDAWLVRVDPNQLDAAILNLAINARDAMPNGGLLRLETTNVVLPCRPGQEDLAGDFVALTVSDTGSGISPEILEQVFEPFFTTKEVGAGSGLGLSMVQGFVKQSSGSIHIDSEVGRGTSVTLYLPRSTDDVRTPYAKAEEPEPGAGTILLVDDDAEVGLVTAQLLELSGYRVITARDSAEAMGCFQREGNRIDVLITDLVLRDGLNGVELAAAIHQERPDLPVLLITGYSDALRNEDTQDQMPVLMKPYEHATLAHAVRQAMETARTPLPAAAVTTELDPPG
jgi:signal transduction histidine kinase/ActR/RegA family two-component response regulator